MFSRLLESRAERTRRPGGTLVSITVHVVLVGAVVAATAKATVPTVHERPEPPLTLTRVDPPPAKPARSPTDPRVFASGRRGSSGGVPGGTNHAPAGGDVFFDWQVEKPALMRPGTRAPVYPAPLRGAGIEGTVLAQVVVDTLGRADMTTLQVLQSEHAFFTSAVKHAIEQMRFLPAEIGERRVPQLVQQTFQFRLDR
jgi:periplasmic protein TonB